MPLTYVKRLAGLSIPVYNWMFHGSFRWPWSRPRVYSFGYARIYAASRSEAYDYFKRLYHG
jgi:hypothetical protein